VFEYKLSDLLDAEVCWVMCCVVLGDDCVMYFFLMQWFCCVMVYDWCLYMMFVQGDASTKMMDKMDEWIFTYIGNQ